MKILSPKIHGYLDFLTVIIFALAPTVFGFDGLPATISYILAVVHLLLTLTTAFPLGIVKIVPLLVHGGIELIVAVALVILPFILDFTEGARNFFVGIGIVIFIVWLISDCRKTSTAEI
ncbi:hypothetical protein BH20ACI1_BH20ACI1_05240 [soil metagenome]